MRSTRYSGYPVNTVWNFANETSQKAIRDRKVFLSGYELEKLTTGFSKCEGVTIMADTANKVCEEYATRRKQFKKARLAWRVSNPKSAKRSLGWIPFKKGNAKYRAGQIVYAGHKFSLWDSYGLGGYELRAGSFNADARGRWYFCAAVEVVLSKSAGTTALGIDLGLKVAATASDGQKVTGRLFRASEKKLATAQRAGHKRQARSIHAKIKNQRADALHKFSTKLVAENGAIFVGDVSAKAMVKTKMAKSTHDAGWSLLKTMFAYKCQQAGVVFAVVPENWTTQTCNACGVIAGPKGYAGLNKRVWACVCGAEHDRDINAALNIRARGLSSLAEGAWA